jgi:hypothetical protein
MHGMIIYLTQHCDKRSHAGETTGLTRPSRKGVNDSRAPLEYLRSLVVGDIFSTISLRIPTYQSLIQ